MPRTIGPVLPCFVLLLGTMLMGNSASGQQHSADDINQDPRYGEIWKKSEELRERPSTDTTPISFSVGHTSYKVPRNYIVHMDDYDRGPQELVTFKVTFPGFEPLTDKTRQCLTSAPAHLPPGCIPIEFWINGGNGVGLSDDEKFNNARKLFHSQTAKQGPHEFEVYDTGPPDALAETYRKKTATHPPDSMRFV